MVAESHTPSPLSPLIHAKVAIPLAAFVVVGAVPGSTRSPGIPD